jgi:nickel-dependent lactate racemase
MDTGASGVIGTGFTDRYLTPAGLSDLVARALDTLPIDGRRVLVIVPDLTRTMPLPRVVDLLEAGLRTRAAALDYLVALGTHQPLDVAQLTRLVGRPVVNGRAGAAHVFNHEWHRAETFVTLGTIPSAAIAELSAGRCACDVTVALNRHVVEYDQVIICGPVFPHEVVGFSGGNKYLVPGIAGADIINFTHWLGALMTCYDVIGAGMTPVRAVIDAAAALVPTPVACFALVVTPGGVAGAYFGSAQDAWRRAAELSASRHIVYVSRPFRRVLAVIPKMYDDLWTAAKGMYKLEPAVADGGEIVIYAPHVREVSYTHGALIDEIGYHCRDYFLGQWDRFRHYPGGVLAHSTHVCGLGRYDSARGVEKPRIRVTLATGIPESRCKRINLGYLDPATIVVEQWQGREDEGVVVIPRAGETLYRVSPEPRAPEARS